MQKKKKDNHFIKQAFYEGGNTAFRKFVSENMQYPKEALENDIEGIVHLKIDINFKGKVIGAKVMKGIGYGCDKEAIRIIKLAEYEVPANPKKLKIKFHKNIRIQFRKPKKVVKKLDPGAIKKTTTQKSMTINYQITPSKNIASNKQKSSEESISYTIKFNS